MSTSANAEITPSRPTNSDQNDNLQTNGRGEENIPSQNLKGSEAQSQDTRSELVSTSPAANSGTTPLVVHDASRGEFGFPPQPESSKLPQTQPPLTGQTQTSDFSPPEREIEADNADNQPVVVSPPLSQTATGSAENGTIIGVDSLPQSSLPVGGNIAHFIKPDLSSAIPSERNREEKDSTLRNENADLRRSPSATGSQADSSENDKVKWGSVIIGLHSIHLKRVEAVRAGLQKLGMKDEFVENTASSEAIHLTKLLVKSLKKYATERSKKTIISADKLLNRVRSARNEGDVGPPTLPISEPSKPTWWSNLRIEVKSLVLANSKMAVTELTNFSMQREFVDKLAEAVVEVEVDKLMVSIEAYGKARAEKAQASRKRISDSIFKTAGIAFSSSSSGKQVANPKKK